MIEYDKEELKSYINSDLANKLKEAFADPTVMSLLRENKYAELYDYWRNVLDLAVHQLTLTFLLADIDFLKYMDHIPNYCFTGLPILKLDVPDNIKTIDADAASYCSRLKELRLSDNVTDIDINAFCYCNVLETVILSDTMKDIPDETFSGCASLENITIPANINTIGDRAFYYCVRLKNIDYLGSTKGWEDISKGSQWAAYTSLETIKCIDGIINN